MPIRIKGDRLDKQLITLMRQFNFSQISAVIYNLLLIEGPLSVKQLESKISAPHKQVEHVLQQLITLRLVGMDHQRGQPYFYATDPSIAWLALATDLVWKIDDKPGIISNLPETDNQSIEGLRMLCNKIGTLAESLYKPYIAALQHKERDAMSFDELSQLTCEMIYSSKSQVIAANRSPRLPQVSSFWVVLTKRIEDGVHYRRIVDLDEIIDHGLSIVLRDVEVYNIDLRVLEKDQLTHSFYIVDKKFLAIINIPVEAHEKTDGNVGRITSQHHIITRYRKRFNQYYTDSIPAHFVIAHMREAAKDLLKEASMKLSPTELLWLKSLIEFGKFSRFHIKERWSEEQLRRVEQKVITMGLARQNADGYSIPIYPINEAKLRTAYIALHKA
jgi:hypothetical protein